MGHGGDVIAELTTDHREVEELFEQFSDAPPGGEDRKRLVDALTIELVRHSVAEEAYLYPAVREHLEDGDALADKELADHARVEQLLNDLERREATDEDFDQLVRELRSEVTAHVDDEENNLFTRLRNGVHPYVLEELGDKVRQAKKSAPTRPHPAAPSTPPANKLLAPGLGLVDRVRDYVSGRGQ
ncbi:Hemerythrin HHE cation binding domain-containing protein [Streptomyces sp. 2224.1]|uniref:hemerythrin domain-containing protein n=1 Tax=unclassified Streptomyces TaxID=2593676 RepID=UPI000889DDF8|nr:MULTISPECIES: hemerythrin domain-containing protein [unclassified Streptomyces]PBC80238.1 hemerythrin HHE cation binding domain-containing protein [Streptomyces sp. 2321.6]SDR59642.1 Hemerythrin HHE cation binding domain-containing protein [Streptomyces sp. KS_16]SEB67224.1 Hemerythrin HHE cation binding domain-containing protein [Streptomyces sp. 2133.1]SED56120.1 Hemerythrin HHE cation binding domain-containing protein [Streptomyces sp. 2224.1]SEF18148.1 Hemerythrin HHE cation binding dom